MIEIQTSLLFTKKELKILKNSKRKKIKSKIQKNKKFIPIFILASYFLFLILLNILIYVFNYNDCLEFAYCILVSLFSIALLTLYFFGKTNFSNITNKEKKKLSENIMNCKMLRSDNNLSYKLCVAAKVKIK